MKLTKYIFSFLVLILSKSIIAQTPNCQWVQRFGGVGEEYAFGITVDDSSNSYVTGYVDAANKIKAANGINCIDHDIFTAKYDSNGNLMWMKGIGGGGDDIGWGIAIDKNKNIYVAASFQDTLNLPNDTLISSGYLDVLIAKYNSNGVFQWAKKAGGNLGDYAYAVAVDSHDDIYLTGSFFGNAIFGTTGLSSRGLNDIFLAKYDTDGNLLWAKNEGGSKFEDDEAYAIAIDKNDNIYLTGKFGDTAYFAGDTLISRGTSDIFIAQFTTDGNLNWIKQAGGTDTDMGQGISTDKSGNIYTTGYFGTTSSFGSEQVMSNGFSDIFITKYDANGNELWVKSAGSTTSDEGAGIAVDANNKIYVTGYFTKTPTFGSQTIVSNGSYDIYLTCIDSVGNFQWAKAIGSIGTDASSSIKIDTANNIFIAGTFYDTCNFDNVTVKSAGSKDSFVAKYLAKSSVGIDENEQEKNALTIFPNPTSGLLNILINQYGNFKPIEIKISNALGQLVYEEKINSQSQSTFHQINLSKFESGFYFLETIIDTKKLVKKIIVE